MPNTISTMKENNAIAWNLTSPELQKRKTEVIAALKAHVLERKEVINGYQYSFDGSDNMLDNLVSFIKLERDCCSFFGFNLSIENAETNIQLRITGPQGAKDFINAEMGL